MIDTASGGHDFHASLQATMDHLRWPYLPQGEASGGLHIGTGETNPIANCVWIYQVGSLGHVKELRMAAMPRECLGLIRGNCEGTVTHIKCSFHRGLVLLATSTEIDGSRSLDHLLKRTFHCHKPTFLRVP